ncbi:hypothetical protein FA95DRAFT_1604845 [Auriscalpium vulgare]|uniref:Uncharacterized protein n=1 Tax=Auriscalpium vulgare TaxID=40419 RepID=A0ACB8RYG4_9AGAM|nr:hypothetical protein FA95DRAFT_1604845 [Auriscalpium vulgare]
MGSHNITVEDSSPLIVYEDESQWIDSLQDSDFSQFSGYAPGFNSYHQTSAVTSFQFPFNGSAIYVFGTTHTFGGPFTVSLTPDARTPSSNVEQTNSTTLASSTLFQQNLYARTNLNSSTPHLLTVQNLGTGTLTFDFLIVESSTTGPAVAREFTIDDAHQEAFSYEGGWTTDLSASSVPVTTLYKETSHRAQAAGATVTLRFRGSSVEVHGEYQSGPYSAQLDGGGFVTIADGQGKGFINPRPDRPAELLYMAEGLSEGDHSVTLTNLGRSNQTWLDIDYAIVSTSQPGNTNGLQAAAAPAGGAIIVQKSNTGAIVGAVLGGIALLLVIVVSAVLFYLRRRDRRRHFNVRNLDLEDNADTFTDKLTPWNLPPPPTPFILIERGLPKIPDDPDEPAPPSPRSPRPPSSPSASTLAGATVTAAVRGTRRTLPPLIITNPSRSLTISRSPPPSSTPVPSVPKLRYSRPLPAPGSNVDNRPAKSMNDRAMTYKRRADRPTLPANPRARPSEASSPPEFIPGSATPLVTPRTPRHASDAGVIVGEEVAAAYEAGASSGKRVTLPPVYDPRWSTVDGAPPVPDNPLVTAPRRQLKA